MERALSSTETSPATEHKRAFYTGCSPHTSAQTAWVGRRPTGQTHRNKCGWELPRSHLAAGQHPLHILRPSQQRSRRVRGNVGALSFVHFFLPHQTHAPSSPPVGLSLDTANVPERSSFLLPKLWHLGKRKVYTRIFFFFFFYRRSSLTELRSDSVHIVQAILPRLCFPTLHLLSLHTSFLPVFVTQF